MPPEMPPQRPSHVPQVALQQSELCAHALPSCEHGWEHVPLARSQTSKPQQSASDPHPWNSPAQPQVLLTQRKEQQSLALAQPKPSSMHAPPLLLPLPLLVPLSSPPPPDVSMHVSVVESQMYAPQQSVELFAGSQSPPTPAHAGWQKPNAQLTEQQSPSALQQSLSSWQNGSVVAHAPPSSPVPESLPVLASWPPLLDPLASGPPPPESLPPPLPLLLPLLLPPLPPASLPPLPLPLLLPVPPSLPPLDPVHLPAVHESEQQSP
jgi:hypothetical protein